MKTLATISIVLAASQCMAEPSGGPTLAAPQPDVGVVDASTAEAATEVTASDLLTIGPAPFTVQTHRIAWPRESATVLVPFGARVEEGPNGATIVLGEGRNFAYRVSGETPAVASGVPRADGAVVWRAGDAWFFFMESGDLWCSNAADARHGEADVEMMLASCRSIEKGSEP